MTATKTIGLVIAGVVISVLLSGLMGAGEALRGVYEITNQVMTSLQVGDQGTAITLVKKGTCNLSQVSPGSHAATSSKAFYCGVTGVRSGDMVFVRLPQAAGTASGGGGFVVGSGFATATDMIGASIVNLSGAASSSYTQATTSAGYLIYR